MNKISVLMFGILAALGAGCDLSSGGGSVPAQAYGSPLGQFARDSADLTGRIQFPSEFAQRSAAFQLDDFRFVTHPDGRFSVSGIPAGKHQLSVTIKGYQPVELPIVLEKDQARHLMPVRLTLARGQVLGRLVHENGHSASGIEVGLEPDRVMVNTDSDGIFQFMGVGAGRRTLDVKDPVYFSGKKHFELRTDERRNLGNIPVYRQLTLTGTVNLRAAKPSN